MKIELDKSTEDFVYNEERLKPFQEHVLKYFCRNNKECYDYFMNYFARKVQMPGRKNGVAIVLKSKDQGCGKGLIIDRLIGQNILGESCYVQVTNIDGLLGNSILS